MRCRIRKCSFRCRHKRCKHGYFSSFRKIRQFRHFWDEGSSPEGKTVNRNSLYSRTHRPRSNRLKRYGVTKSVTKVEGRKARDEEKRYRKPPSGPLLKQQNWTFGQFKYKPLEVGMLSPLRAIIREYPPFLLEWILGRCDFGRGSKKKIISEGKQPEPE